ncbi:hypothetical protein QWJ34_26865 [Saccharibacillus sp. CPCC 101409]|uniref:hypothetical protein n=1 Tax=Saccharibacillus sp. CPCC 101409 TaxID=3058041 RepID=UPI00267166BC|nr:hypothetical protein [Saccharibacillus sp. CPCC 101409]MDO3413400.1 hypothetical protein [Saccharibacillus sp. CPCC 101409]
MNSSFEVHTEQLNKNLETIERYMERFKNSIRQDMDKAFDITLDHINNSLPFKNLISEVLDKVNFEELREENQVKQNEIELTIEMNSIPPFFTDLKDNMSEAAGLMKISSENAYAEARIHIYSIFTHIIVVFEDYLKRILEKEDSFNNLLTYVNETFKSNNINANSWYRRIKKFQRVRNLIVHKNGEQHPGQYLVITVNDDLKPLIKSINEFVEKYRELLKKSNDN